jgi:hypothetical protein
MKAGRIIVGGMLVFAVLALLGAAYVGGYLWLGEERRWSSMHDAYVNGERVWIDDGLTIERSYSRPWQAQIFKLAGWIESSLWGIEVQVVHRDEQIEGTSESVADSMLVAVGD